MKQANYNSETGIILGFYETDIHTTIPTPVIDLTEEEWQDCIDNNGCRKVNTDTLAIEVCDSDIFQTDEDKFNAIRTARNTLLQKSDWTQLDDVALDPQGVADWTVYRQVLRDFPATVDLNNIVWPTSPA